MRSAVPKHFHPCSAGRWSTGSSTPATVRAPIRSSWSRRPRRRSVSRTAVSSSPCRSSRSAPATRFARRARRSRRTTGTCSSSRATRRCSRPELLLGLVDAHRRAGADATVLSCRARRSAAVRPHRPRGDGDVEQIVEGTDANDDERRIREVNTSIYVFRSATLWAALEQLEPKNVQGELYLTDAVEIVVARRRARSLRTSRPTGARPTASTRAPSSPSAAAVLRDRINERHMLAGVTIVDPKTTWIEPTVEIEQDVTIHPFTILRGETRVATGAEVGANTVAIDAHIGRGATVGPFCYLRPGTVLGESSKAGTFVEIKNSRIGDRTKVPHLSYIGDAEIGDDTNVGAGAITANFPHRPGQPKGRTTDRQQRQDRDPQWLRRADRGRGRSMDRCRIGHNQGRPRRCARHRPAAPGEQGGICSTSARRLSSSFPASRAPDSMTQPEPGHWIERGPQKRLMVFSGRSHTDLAAADRRAARRRARRGRAAHVRERRDLRAATTSRSAAPTSSSCRPAASRSTAT